MEDKNLFRGKTGEWGFVVGTLASDSSITEVHRYGESRKWSGGKNWHVNPDTIGRCVGRHDKNHKLIFEDDIVKIPGDSLSYYEDIENKVKGIVRFGEYQSVNGCRDGIHLGYYIEWVDKTMRETHRCDILYWIDKGVEIIGNIHKNHVFTEVQSNDEQDHSESSQTQT